MNNEKYIHVVKEIAAELHLENVGYQFTEGTSLFLQGVMIKSLQEIHLRVQWDQFEAVYEKYHHFEPKLQEKNEKQAGFQYFREGIKVLVDCLYNISIKTDPYRIIINHKGEEIWCQSLYTYLFDEESTYRGIVESYLFKKQHELNETNENAWNQNNYYALLNRYGQPNELAIKIKQNPEWRLHPFQRYLGDIRDKRIVHLMGSNGVKGTAMALLGANVTVVDFSKENQRFAREVAEAAGVTLEYILSDVLSLDNADTPTNHDIVLMELGVLHYFIDLSPLARTVSGLLKESGRFVLHEFHPISTKLLTSTGKKHKVTGNYFDPTIHTKNVAFTKHMDADEQQNLSKVLQRYWTLGEIVTAFAREGLFVEVLDEEPNHKLHDIGIPKTFTLCAIKRKVT